MLKRKTITMLLGILLISGGTFVGTKAWLKDQKSVNNDLVITTGNFKLDVEVPSSWEIISEDGTEISNPTNNNGFKNVRPGDKFRKTITIQNSGSLNQYLTIQNPEVLLHNPYIDILDIQYKNLDNIDNQTILSQETKEFDIVVSTKPTLMENGKHENIEIDFSEIISPIIINSKQVNEK